MVRVERAGGLWLAARRRTWLDGGSNEREIVSRSDVRVPIPLFSDEGALPAVDAPSESKAPALPNATVDTMKKLLDETLSRTQSAWTLIEEGAPLEQAREQMVKATAALIGLRNEI